MMEESALRADIARYKKENPEWHGNEVLKMLARFSDIKEGNRGHSSFQLVLGTLGEHVAQVQQALPALRRSVPVAETASRVMGLAIVKGRNNP